MRYSSFSLFGLVLLASNQTAVAQGLPSWADDVFPDRRSWRSERNYYYQAPVDRPRTDTVHEGGARPDIVPLAPPSIPFPAAFPANSIVIDVGERKLYYVLPNARAYAYRISVGREGFNWIGTETVMRKQAWPDWHPPAEMRERDPKLPEKMTGGVRNPLGAMALYLGNSLYRIHGTNDVKSIGQAQSSGCFRMLNAEVLHLASITEIGTTVVVVNSLNEPVMVSKPPEPSATEVSVIPKPPAVAPAQPASDYRSLREEMLKRR